MKKQNQSLADVRKALSSKQVATQAAAAIRGGDGDEAYPWVDKPGR